MDNKIVLAVLISTILGATIGFAGSYILFSSPIQSLQDDLAGAKADISGLSSDMTDVDDRVTGLQTSLSSTQGSMTSLQNSLSTTQSNLASLNSTVNAMNSSEWHEVRSLGGSSDTVTGTFQLKGKVMKISWISWGLSTDAWVEVDLRFSNGTLYWVNGSSGVWGAFDAEGAIPQTGLYYLDISSYNADSWSVAIYDYY